VAFEPFVRGLAAGPLLLVLIVHGLLHCIAPRRYGFGLGWQPRPVGRVFREKSVFNSIDISGGEMGRDFAIKDHNGQLRRLNDFAGKFVVVFLATPSARMSAPPR